jgi:hypothetical protein
MQKQITPPFECVFPPRFVPAVAPDLVIGKPREPRTLRQFTLKGYGAGEFTVQVWSVRQAVGYRAAVMGARLKKFGPRTRITEVTFGNVIL